MTRMFAWLWYLQQPFVITLCNSIGTPLDFKYIDLPPLYVAMTASHVVVTSREAFYMWQFKNVKQRAIMEVSNRLKAGMEKLVTILFSYCAVFCPDFWHRILGRGCAIAINFSANYKQITNYMLVWTNMMLKIALFSIMVAVHQLHENSTHTHTQERSCIRMLNVHTSY